MEKAIRVWGVFVGIIYSSTVLGLVVIIAMRDPPENNLRIIAFVAPSLVAVAVFIWGVVIWNTRLAWIMRVIAWFVLLLSLIPLISFSFVLFPLLMSALPNLWRSDIRST